METSIYLEISLLIIVSIVFLLSIIGCFVPAIPATPLAFLAILSYKLLIPASSETWTFVIISGVLALIAQVLDIFLTYLGAKKFGATWKGSLGALIGVIVGIFIPPQIIWIFVAPMIGAFVFEFLGGRTFTESSKAGLGAFIGAVLSTVLKLGIVFAMIVGFFTSLNILSVNISS